MGKPWVIQNFPFFPIPGCCFNPKPMLFFFRLSRRRRDFFNERVYMLNVQKHLPKYNQHLCMLLIVMKVRNVNFDERRTHC